ncbi:glycosyltransferase family 2 protein [Auraticoccus monumenti]|uniref:Glycosyltransferase involved in cell wall bisynthesis n=1 Tax=Auraticoccus monumenti TaxID=675864 RepID=A0A1G7D4W2_9ACTN|nr:glycosyltransferase family A protein [Auraticoccus monumenti]SDE46557.1 Glycosyltransferase involved in cell wall bisynthesis [Auraticoccus monumenti]
MSTPDQGPQDQHEDAQAPGAPAVGAVEPDVTVVVPVYDAMPYLVELLDSLVAQDLAPERLQVVMVDDGSTDDGPQTLDRYAAEHPPIEVVHQENAGWPGPPRNHGLDLARGRYVFFADSDDRLGPEALRRMVEFADEHGSDIVLPKLVGLGGRGIGAPLAADNLVDVDPELVMPSLGPIKLFRRSMLLEHGIRFPEEKVRLEDGFVMAQAYYVARRISVLVDYDHYFVRLRDDGQNISMQALDPVGYSWSVGQVADRVRRHDPDPARADRVVSALFRRKCLKMYAPARFAAMPAERRQQWVENHQLVMARHVGDAMVADLGFPFRQRAELVRAGDVEGLLALGRLETDPGYETRATELGWSRRGGLRLVLETTGDDVPGDRLLLLRRRGGPDALRVPLRGPRDRVETTLPATVDLAEGTWDLSVEKAPAESAPKVRVRVDEATAVPDGRGRLEPYRTANGNLSLRAFGPPRRSLALVSPPRRPVPAAITRVAVTPGTLTVRCEVTTDDRTPGLQAQLEALCRDPAARVRPGTVLRRLDGGRWEVEATFEAGDFNSRRSGFFGLWLELTDTRGQVRLRLPSPEAPRTSTRVPGLRADLYTSSHGNLSLRCR